MSAQLEEDLVNYFAKREAVCARDTELARWVAGELAGAEADAMAQHLQTCLDCQGLADELAACASVWNSFAAPQPVSKLPRMVRIVAMPVMALAAALFLLVWVERRSEGNRLTPKGGLWSLELAVQRGGQQFLVPSGAELRTGDQLGLFYSSPNDGWLTVLYADGHGEPTRIFPAREKDSAKVSAGNNLPLSDGAVLDEGNGCEWVVGVFTKTPLSAERATALVKQMVSSRQGCTLAPPLPGSHVETRVVVVKRGAAP